MQISVAVPVYDGRLPVQTAIALFNEQGLANGVGDAISFHFVTGNAGIVQARNQLAHEFMDSPSERLVFVDADVTFEPGDLIKLAHRPVDLVGGAYRYKMADESYPIRWLPDPEKKGLWTDEAGLIEVEAVPTGFMSISKEVFRRHAEAHPERLQEHLGHLSFTYFQMPFVDGVAYGEDYFFCKEWRALGGKVYLDPEINLTHWGFAPTPHVGHIGNWLKSRKEGAAA
jgi:hypothetical protein